MGNNLSVTLSDYSDSTISKSFINNDLEKAEGSRGGKIIGHTKSGKPVYENKIKDIAKHLVKNNMTATHNEIHYVAEKLGHNISPKEISEIKKEHDKQYYKKRYEKREK